LSKIEVNAVEPQCGTTLTLGASGDTVTLGSGASQSGFGRTGTVDWDTTAKTASFTAVSGNGYFVDTTSGAITVTLPASPSAGDIVAIADYAGTAASNNITVGRNSSKIEGNTENAIININRESKTLVYVDATQGWLPVNDNADAISNSKFVTATGGTVTTCGNFKIHTFTGQGTFCVSCAGNALGSSTVDYMVVAGGAAGGSVSGGGGGAGGWRASSGTASGSYTAGPGPLTAPVSALSVTTTGYPVTVGAGGAASGSTSPEGPNGNPGNNSVFSTVTSTGGGGGSSRASPGGSSVPGGSGGGGSASISGGTGNTPPVTPPQGNTGGNGINTPTQGGGGGGGAGAVGTAGFSGPTPTVPSGGVGGGAGGVGVTSCISGSPVAYAGGGGGGINGGCSVQGAASPCGTGGRGGRYHGAPGPLASTAGTTNRGGGGGGGGADGPVNGGDAAGGSGIVIIRYKFQ